MTIILGGDKLKIVKEFGIIFFCLLLGNITKSFIDFPIPDTVYGMIYLFIAMNLKIVRLNDLQIVPSGLLDNLQLFLIPPTVAIVNAFDLIKGELLQLFIIIFISTIITIVVTGSVVSFVQRRIVNE